MVGTVITLSPRMPPARAEQIVRGRVERDGEATVAASSADGRQVRQLRRLRDRLAADPGLEMFVGAAPDGVTYLAVAVAGRRTAGYRVTGSWGSPKTG